MNLMSESREMLEVHLPISPNRHFFTMAHYFAASLRLKGGALADSRLVITVGEDCEPYDLYAQTPWSKGYNIEWRWVERGLFRQYSYYATALERFRRDFRAPAVLLADADTFITGDFHGLVEDCLAQRAFSGVIAHGSPFRPNRPGLADSEWRRLYQAAGLAEPKLQYEHTGLGFTRSLAEARFCPPYFNLGMLAAPAEVMHAIGERFYDTMALVDRVYPTNFKCQIALTLILEQLDIPIRTVPVRFNFPNDDKFAGKYPAELATVRLFHYLRRKTGPFDKQRDFADYPAVEAFLQRTDIAGVNQVMQQALRPVHRRVMSEIGN